MGCDRLLSSVVTFVRKLLLSSLLICHDNAGLSLQRMGDICLRVGIKIRAALISAVAKKALGMESVKKELSAEIVSFVASDIHKASPACTCADGPSFTQRAAVLCWCLSLDT